MTHQPTIITEEQAQELANIHKRTLATDIYGYLVFGKKEEIKKWITSSGKYCYTFSNSEVRPKVMVSSTRPWTEQIWRPE